MGSRTPVFAACAALLLSAASAADRKDAYYLFYAQDLVDAAKDPYAPTNASFPSTWAGYDIMITQPLNLTQELVQEVHEALHFPRMLAYWDTFHTAALGVYGCSTGDVMGDKPTRLIPYSNVGPYAEAMQAAGFHPNMTARQVYPNGTTEVLCTYPGLATYVLNEDSVEVISNFLVTWVKKLGLDGVYLDNSATPTSFLQWAENTLTQNGKIQVDVNGDGVADTPAQMAAQYSAWRPALTTSIRRALGVSATMLGNSGGILSDPNLNGVTIEMESCAFDLSACRMALQAQHAVATPPAASVAWLTHSNDVPEQKQCEVLRELQAEMPWVYAGTDFFDGSRVVCP